MRHQGPPRRIPSRCRQPHRGSGPPLLMQTGVHVHVLRNTQNKRRRCGERTTDVRGLVAGLLYFRSPRKRSSQRAPQRCVVFYEPRRRRISLAAYSEATGRLGITMFAEKYDKVADSRLDFRVTFRLFKNHRPVTLQQTDTLSKLQ